VSHGGLKDVLFLILLCKLEARIEVLGVKLDDALAQLRAQLGCRRALEPLAIVLQGFVSLPLLTLDIPKR